MTDAVTRSRIMNSLFWQLLFISLDLIVIACIVAYLLAKAVSVPLEHIRAAIQSVENNDLNTRVPILSNDEMGEVAGNIGSPEKMSYALVGDTVNTASRLEGLTKDYGVDIIISQTTYNLLTGSYRTEQLPPVTVKWKIINS